MAHQASPEDRLCPLGCAECGAASTPRAEELSERGRALRVHAHALLVRLWRYDDETMPFAPKDLESTQDLVLSLDELLDLPAGRCRREAVTRCRAAAERAAESWRPPRGPRPASDLVDDALKSYPPSGGTYVDVDVITNEETGGSVQVSLRQDSGVDDLSEKCQVRVVDRDCALKGQKEVVATCVIEVGARMPYAGVVVDARRAAESLGLSPLELAQWRRYAYFVDTQRPLDLLGKGGELTVVLPFLNEEASSNPGPFINDMTMEGVTPNVYFEQSQVQKQRWRVDLVASSQLEPEEQLCVDYSSDYWLLQPELVNCYHDLNSGREELFGSRRRLLTWLDDLGEEALVSSRRSPVWWWRVNVANWRSLRESSQRRGSNLTDALVGPLIIGEYECSVLAPQNVAARTEAWKLYRDLRRSYSVEPSGSRATDAKAARAVVFDARGQTSTLVVSKAGGVIEAACTYEASKEDGAWIAILLIAATDCDSLKALVQGVATLGLVLRRNICTAPSSVFSQSSLLSPALTLVLGASGWQTRTKPLPRQLAGMFPGRDPSAVVIEKRAESRGAATDDAQAAADERRGDAAAVKKKRKLEDNEDIKTSKAKSRQAEKEAAAVAAAAVVAAAAAATAAAALKNIAVPWGRRQRCGGSKMDRPRLPGEPWSLIGTVFEVSDGGTLPYRGVVVDVHRDKSMVVLGTEDQEASQLEPGSRVESYWKQGEVPFAATIMRKRRVGGGVCYDVRHLDGVLEERVTAQHLAPAVPVVPPSSDYLRVAAVGTIVALDDESWRVVDVWGIDEDAQYRLVPHYESSNNSSRSKKPYSTATKVVSVAELNPTFVVRYDGGLDGQEMLKRTELLTMVARGSVRWAVDRSDEKIRWVCGDAGATRSSLDFHLGAHCEEEQEDELPMEWEPAVGHAAQCCWLNGRHYPVLVTKITVDAKTKNALYDVDYAESCDAEPSVDRDVLRPLVATSNAHPCLLLLGKFDVAAKLNSKRLNVQVSPIGPNLGICPGSWVAFSSLNILCGDARRRALLDPSLQ